jgi:hypothetical protein
LAACGTGDSGYYKFLVGPDGYDAYRPIDKGMRGCGTAQSDGPRGCGVKWWWMVDESRCDSEVAVGAFQPGGWLSGINRYRKTNKNEHIYPVENARLKR